MTEPLTVTVDERRRAMSIVFDRREETMGPQIDLGADYYWHIGLRESFDMSATPEGAPLAGQLTDDVASVRELISASSAPRRSLSAEPHTEMFEPERHRVSSRSASPDRTALVPGTAHGRCAREDPEGAGRELDLSAIAAPAHAAGVTFEHPTDGDVSHLGRQRGPNSARS